MANVRTISVGIFGTFLYDPDADEYQFDPAAQRILGDLAKPGTSYADILERIPLVARRSYEQWRQKAVTRGAAGRVRVPFRLTTREIILEVQIQRVGSDIQGLIADVTTAENRYQDMVNQIMVMNFAESTARFGIWAYNIKEGKVTASKGVVDLLAPDGNYSEFDVPSALALVRELVHEEDCPGLQQAYARALGTGQIQHAEFRLANDSDCRYITQFMRVLDDAGEPVKVYGMVHDVTLLHRSRTLQAKHEELEGAQELRSRFVNAAAHELSQPLTPLRIQLALLRTQVPKESDLQRSLNIIDQNLERLSFILQDLLDAARFQAGHLHVEPQPVSLTEHVALAVETFSGMAGQRDVMLERQCEAEPVVFADPIRLQQCLNNIVHNAIKFTAEGTNVHIRVEEQDGQAVVTVQDKGPGLDAEQVQRAFEPFERIHKGPRGHGGTGLGLYITKVLTEAMGGTVDVQSEPGKGSTFALRLNKATPSSSPRNRPVESSMAASASSR